MSLHAFDLKKPTDAVWLRRHLCEGGLVICAAEGVWGLCCDPFHPEAILQLNDIKKRKKGKGYILVSGQRSHFDGIESYLNARQKALLRQHWPGAVSFVVPDKARLFPPWVAVCEKGKGEQSVALRHTAHPQLAGLSELIASPVVSTSANHAGEPPALSKKDLAHYFGHRLVTVKSTVTKPGGASAIIDVTTGEKIR